MSSATLRLAESSPATGAVRVVTAASLFDGHDASINIVRRILQAQGAEVIHLGHDRGVDEIVDAALQEDAHAVCISSYQGGHMEYFRYLVEQLRARGAGHIRVYGGGGGVIVPEEIERLHALGVARIFSPEDGRRLGLEGMIRPDRRRVGTATAGRRERGAGAALTRGAGRRRAAGELARRARRRDERGTRTRPRSTRDAASRRPRADRRVHRHGWRGQVQRRRRGAAPAAPRSPRARRSAVCWSTPPGAAAAARCSATASA